MADPTREEIERLIATMRASERASAAGAAVASVFYWLGKVTCALHALFADSERLEHERDVALARVAELEAALKEAIALTPKDA